MAVAVSLLDDAYPTAGLNSRRDVYRSVLVVQVEGFGRDDLTGYGDLNGVAGLIALDFAVNSIGRCLRRFVGGWSSFLAEPLCSAWQPYSSLGRRTRWQERAK